MARGAPASALGNRQVDLETYSVRVIDKLDHPATPGELVRVTDGQDEARDVFGRMRLVLGDRHGGIVPNNRFSLRRK